MLANRKKTRTWYHKKTVLVMESLDEVLEVLEGAELGVDGLVVGDVVAVVLPGGGVDGGEPDGAHTKISQVVNL